MPLQRLTIHLIANAHLDPVWLWDWREGLNEGLTTVRTVLDLMEEFPELTFTRGESAIYEHVEQQDPTTFSRIAAQVKSGRWEIVGGTYIQPDNNLPRTEALARQFTHAQHYFASRFGRTPSVAWAADAFGHAAGLPEIFHSAGIRSFAFTRPEPEHFDVGSPAFWWEGTGGSRILTYRPPIGWYGTERHEIPKRLEQLVEDAERCSLKNIGCLWGLGNHGGGPTRRQLKDITQWASKHPGIRLLFSGLHRFFDALRQEEERRGFPFPIHRGELNFTKRGCYTSSARLKHVYRQAEAQLIRAEKTDSLIRAFLGQPPATWGREWKALLFNAFHDILPGTSIERASNEQLASLATVSAGAQRKEFQALNALAAQVDTTVPKPRGDHPSLVPVLVWNPHPHTYRGPVEIEVSLDYRPLWDYIDQPGEVPVEVLDFRGRRIPFQLIDTENPYSPELPWRKRAVIEVTLPPASWSVYRMGWSQLPRRSQSTRQLTAHRGLAIKNGSDQVRVSINANAIRWLHGGKVVLPGGISACTIDDPWGAWGGPAYEAGQRSDVAERWKVTDCQRLENGPLRSTLWVRLAGERSRLDLTFALCRGRDAVDVHARLFWNERSRRLLLNFPGGHEAEYDVPGGILRRGQLGDVPGGQWVRVYNRASHPLFGFASNAIYGFRCDHGLFSASIVRACRYADNKPAGARDRIQQPVADSGEYVFRFLLTRNLQSLPWLAEHLEEPVVTLTVPPSQGKYPSQGSLFSLNGNKARLLALKPAQDGNGWVARIQEISGKAGLLRGRWLDRPIDCGTLAAHSLNTFRIAAQGNEWKVSRVDILERPNPPAGS